MSKLLILCRHAEAVDRSLSNSDRNRELTGKGLTQSYQVGHFLTTNLYTIDAIFASSATRAAQTASLAADAMKFPSQRIVFDDELYDASARTFFQFVSAIDDSFDCALCVGHNPTVSYLTEYLTKEAIGDMSTASLALISFDIRTWKDVGEGKGKLIRYVDPSTVLNT
jgi:phosphohistidine phosphatase